MGVNLERIALQIRQSIMQSVVVARKNQLGSNNGLEKEITELDARIKEAKAELNAANTAIERSYSYPEGSHPHYCCPDCWINKGAETMLTPDTSGPDARFFDCSICHFHLSA